jgi:hypothetical protein
MWAQVVIWFSKAQAKIVALGAILVSLLYIQHAGKRKAAKQAVKQERQRINTATIVKKQIIKEQAHEIDQAVAGADTDDLRERMRKQATDRDSR